MTKKTIQEAVKFLVKYTLLINSESAKWKFKSEDIEKVMAVTKQNTIEYHMLTIMKNNADSAAQSKV
jgi:hypothetical protein